MDKLAQIYLPEIIQIHGVPKTIVSDRDPRFQFRFWTSLSKALGTRLHPSIAANPQTEGQSDRTIQILEDILRACTLDLRGTGKIFTTGGIRIQQQLSVNYLNATL